MWTLDEDFLFQNHFYLEVIWLDVSWSVIQKESRVITWCVLICFHSIHNPCYLDSSLVIHNLQCYRNFPSMNFLLLNLTLGSKISLPIKNSYVLLKNACWNVNNFITYTTVLLCNQKNQMVWFLEKKGKWNQIAQKQHVLFYHKWVITLINCSNKFHFT